MMRIWRAVVWLILVFGLAAVLWTMRATTSNPWDRVMLSFYASLQYDTWQSDSLIVEIDDASLDAVGSWPWPRKFHAQLITALSQADVIVYDVAFVGDTNSQNDQPLVDAVKAHGRVVVPLLAERDPETLYLNTLLPFGELADVATLGHIDVPVSRNGDLSTLYLKAGNANAQFPILALAAIALQEYDLPEIDGQRPGYERNMRSGLWVRDYANIILPRVNIDSVQRISASEVLQGKLDDVDLSGRTVFVGLRSDRVAKRVNIIGDPSPGAFDVDIQLQAYEAIKRTGLLKRSSNTLATLLGLLCFGLMAASIWLRSLFAKAVCVFSALLGLLLVPLSLAVAFDIWLLQGFGLLAVIFAVVAGFLTFLQSRFGVRLPDNAPAYDALEGPLMAAFANAPLTGVFAVALVEIDFFDRFITANSHARVISSYERIKRVLEKRWPSPLLAMVEAGNYGFMLCLQFDDQSQFEASWQSLPKAIEQLKISHDTSTASHFMTISAGAAAADVALLDQPELLAGNALVALKQALAQGRNQANIFQ